VIRAAMNSPVMADFAANLDRINALAESMPGFVRPPFAPSITSLCWSTYRCGRTFRR
jgi:hypothetical protein